MTGIIDAHQHCWQLNRPECHWPTPEFDTIYRDFSPADYWAEAGELGVDGSVLVQSQPNAEDTQYLLSLAESEPRILGVVGWVDLSAPDAVGQVRALAAQPRLCGLRPMLQDLEEDDWILVHARRAALEAMAETGLVFDALVFPRHLPVIETFARRHPTLTIVLDHAGKPDIAQGALEFWAKRLASLAACPNVHCKLSGLATEMSPSQPWGLMHDYLDVVLDQFGPERILWGSDWPVLTLAGSHRDWLALARERVRHRHSQAETAVFRDNARRVYGLPQPGPDIKGDAGATTGQL